MSVRAGKDAAEIFMELEARALRVARADTLRAWDLERAPDGRLEGAFRQRLVAELSEFVGRRVWQGRIHAVCAIPAGGISFRRWTVPANAPDLEGILRLRLESEFPLSPEELAWGWVPLGASRQAEGLGREILLVAVRRAGLQELHDVLVEAGLAPTFTVAALARAALHAWPPTGGGLLHVGRDQTEWLSWDEQGPARLRVLSWGESDLLRELEAGLGLGRREAEKVLAGLADGTREDASKVWPCVDAAVARLQAQIPALPGQGRVGVTGARWLVPVLNRALNARWGDSPHCEVVDREEGQAPSSAMKGLRRAGAADGSFLVVLGMRAPEETVARVPETPRRWMALAAVLLLLVLALPYAEAWIQRPRLAERVEAVKSKQGQLRMIDREVEFLRYLRTNQTAHLETLLVLGRCAPNGARIDSFHLNRKGELALRISMRQPPEAVEFRRKLVNSGFFQDVVVEEQSPSPDRQKLLVRLSAVLRPASLRENLPILGTNEPAGGGTGPGGPGGPPGMPPGMPMGMPPGFPMPMPPG